MHFRTAGAETLPLNPLRKHLLLIRTEATEIWSMCWPIVVSMFVTSVNDTVNAKAAAVLGPQFQTAVSIVDQINFSLVMILMALGIGVNAVLSRAKGANDISQCRYILGNALRLSLAVGTSMAVLSVTVIPSILPFLIEDANVLSIARTYTIYSAAHLLPYAVICMLTAGMRSIGDAKSPMYGVLLSGLIICCLSTSVAMVPELRNWLGVSGIGIASCFGSAIGSWFIVARLRRNQYGTKVRLFGTFPLKFAKQVLAIGIPAGLQRLCWSLALMALLWVIAIARMPLTISTALTVGLRIESFAFLPTWAASFGVAVLVGNALGAGDRARAFSLGWATTTMSLMLSFVLGGLLFALAKPLAQFMSSDVANAAELALYLQVAAFRQPILAIMNTLIGSMQGAGDTRYAMWASVVTNLLLRSPLAYVLALMTSLGPLGIWLIMTASIGVNCLLIIARYQSKRWLDIRV